MKFSCIIFLTLFNLATTVESPAEPRLSYTREQIDTFSTEAKKAAIESLESKLIQTLTDSTSSSLTAQQLKKFFKDKF